MNIFLLIPPRHFLTLIRNFTKVDRNRSRKKENEEREREREKFH
jgi:hypothetical protein